MKFKIEYKTDRSTSPYCAFTYAGGEYVCHWSSTSFAEAKEILIKKLGELPQCPPSEEVEV